MVLVQKWAFSNFLFWGNIDQENVFCDILERKNAFLAYESKKFKKSKYWFFFRGVNPWFSSKNGHFSNFFFLGNMGQENVFYDILEQKNAFLSYKNKKFKKSKNWHFFKVVNPWFWSKYEHFSNFLFWGNIDQENVFCDILEGKNAFLAYKNKKLKKSKYGFGPKMGIFQLSFLRQYRPGKCLLRYSRAKNAFLVYTKKKFKMSKYWHFSKRVNPWFWSKYGHFSNFFLAT